MEEKEAVHYLKVLVELDLYKQLTAVTEGNLPKDLIDKEQQRLTINFINGLRDEYKKLPNRDEIIIETLDQMGLQTMWGQKKREEMDQVNRTQQKAQTSPQTTKKVDEIEK